MKPEEALTIMKMTQPLATLEHAATFLAVAEDRGLTPFQEIWPIFSEKKEKQGAKWVVTGIKGLSFKEHYSVQNRWSQKSGGYSVPYRKTTRTQRPSEYRDNETVSGIEVEVGIITNRDYAALAAMAAMRIPGWNYEEERKAFMHFATSFVPDSHRPPSGWTIEDVARKRAEETALRKAFGKEPSQSRQLYTNAVAAITMEDATAALFPAPQKREALPAPEVVEGEYAEFDPEADQAALDAFVESEAERYAKAAQAAKTGDTPAVFDDTPFTTPEAAIQWGVTSGAFAHGAHAKNAYNKLRDEAHPESAREMARLWRADVARRLAEKA